MQLQHSTKQSLKEVGRALCLVKEENKAALKRPQPESLLPKGSLDTGALPRQHIWLKTTLAQTATTHRQVSE